MKFKIFGILAIFIQPYISIAASFDCGLANGFVENSICTEQDLSKLDDELSIYYKSAKSNAENSEIITQEQLDWLKKRNLCTTKECIIEKYSNRISELKLPIAPNSKPLKLTREYCREKAEQPDIVKCITAKIWDPCSEGASGSSWWGSQCGWAHLEIAENKIKEAQNKIENLLSTTKNSAGIKEFKESEALWLSYRDKYCEFTNGLALKGGGFPLAIAFCRRRLSEVHVRELSVVYPEIQSVIEFNTENP